MGQPQVVSPTRAYFIMASPQLENGYMRIANELGDVFCRHRIRGLSWQILWTIFRKTYGYNKKEDWISHTQIVEATGLKKGNVSRELSKLITMNIVIRSDNKLRLNKDYDTWKLSEVITHKKLSKVITSVIKSDNKVIRSEGNNIQYTKDNTTKEIIHKNVLGFGNPDINEISSYFLQVFQIPKEDCSKGQSRQYWYHLLRESKTGASGVKWLIDQAHEDEFYRNNITSSKDLYYKRVKIIARKRGNIPKVAVMPKEAI